VVGVTVVFGGVAVVVVGISVVVDTFVVVDTGVVIGTQSSATKRKIVCLL